MKSKQMFSFLLYRVHDDLTLHNAFVLTDPCDKGSYHDVASNTCKLCPKGEYQDKEGHTSCVRCPSGHTTVGKGVTHSDSCQSELSIVSLKCNYCEQRCQGRLYLNNKNARSKITSLQNAH